MNKKISRIAAIALTAAMVSSAFAMSTSSAFAAATVTASIDTVKVSLSSDSTNKYAADNVATHYVTGASNTMGAPVPKITIGDKDYSAQGVDWDGAWQSSNTNLAAIDATGVVTVNNDNISKDQDVTFTRELKIKANAEVNKHNNVAEQTATVPVKIVARIYKNGATYVLPGTLTNGAYVSSAATISANEGVHVAAYEIGSVASTKMDAGTATFAKPASATYKFVSSDGNVKLKSGKVESTAGDGDDILAQPAGNVHTGATTVSIQKKVNDSFVAVTDANTAGITVADTYKVDKTAADSTATPASSLLTASQQYEGTKTYLTSAVDANQTDKKYNVTGKNIVLADDVTALTVNEFVNLGTITGGKSGTLTTITVNGHTGDITTPAAVTVATLEDKGTDGSATTGNITADGVVTVTGSTKKSTTLDKYASVKTGNITGKNAITVTAGENKLSDNNYEAEGAVAVGDITEKGTDATTLAKDTVTLDAGEHVNSMTVGKLSGTKGAYDDCPYSAGLIVSGSGFNLGDLTYFGNVTIGKANKTTNVTVGQIDTGKLDGTSLADSCGRVSASKLLVLADSKLTASKITTASVDPTSAGTIIVPVDSVEIKSNTPKPAETNATLVVSNATQGSILFRSNEQAQNLFKIPGVVTVEGTQVSSGSNVYTYSAKTLQSQGIKATETNVKIGKDAKTLSVVNVPNAALPDGVTVAWKADKDSVKLTPSADGHSCVVEATGYTENNINGSNNVNVTAYLKKGDAVYQSDDTPLSAATIAVTLTNEASAAPVLTTTVTDLDGKKTVVTGDTVVKMTQSTYNTVNFAADKAGITDIKYYTGNDKVAQTGTTTAWNGTTGAYNVYANGKVGDKVGVYANGVRVFQIEIVDRPFTCDTTVDFQMKAGKTYTFKITPAAGTKIDTFDYLTANGKAVGSWKGTGINADGTVTRTIKAFQSTNGQKVGVYAKINGVTYKVFAVEVTK